MPGLSPARAGGDLLLRRRHRCHRHLRRPRTGHPRHQHAGRVDRGCGRYGLRAAAGHRTPHPRRRCLCAQRRVGRGQHGPDHTGLGQAARHSRLGADRPRGGAAGAGLRHARRLCGPDPPCGYRARSSRRCRLPGPCGGHVDRLCRRWRGHTRADRRCGCSTRWGRRASSSTSPAAAWWTSRRCWRPCARAASARRAWTCSTTSPHIDPGFAALPNVVLQPHHASGTVETRAAMGRAGAREPGSAFRRPPPAHSPWPEGDAPACSPPSCTPRATCASRNCLMPCPALGRLPSASAPGGICGSDMHYYLHGGFGTVRLQQPMVLGHEIAGEVLETGPGVTAVLAGGPRGGEPQPALRPLPLLPGRPCQPVPGHALLRQRHADAACTGRLPSAPGLRREPGGEAAPLHALRDRGLRRAAGRLPACGAAGRPLAGPPRAGNGNRAYRRPGHPGRPPWRSAGGGGDRPFPHPLALARRIGADLALDLRAEPSALERFAADKGHFDVVFEASGSGAALAGAIQAARPGATIVQLGLGGEVPLPVNVLVAKEITLRGTFRFDTGIRLGGGIPGQRRHRCRAAADRGGAAAATPPGLSSWRPTAAGP
jgi:L-idonate 5-dehydrogenase